MKIDIKKYISEEFGILPSTLPYDVVKDDPAKQVARYDAMPDEMRYKMQIQLSYWPRYLALPDSEGGLDLLEIDYTAPLASVADKRITVSYEPARDIDRQMIADAGGNMYDVYPATYLYLWPRLLIDGVKPVGANHPDDISMGLPEYLWYEIIEPGGGRGYSLGAIENVVKAGDHVAIAIDYQLMPTDRVQAIGDELRTAGQSDPPPSDVDELMGRQLALTGHLYFHEIDTQNILLAQEMGIRLVRRPSVALAHYGIEVSYLFDLAPLEVTGSNVVVDLDYDSYAPIPKDGDAAKSRNFTLLSGFYGSLYEEIVLQQLFQAKSASTLRIIQQAGNTGVPIYMVTANNVDVIMPHIKLMNSPAGAGDIAQAKIMRQEKAELDNIASAARAGKVILVPQNPVTMEAFTGSAYIIMDPQTGSGTYMITGGYSGGTITDDVKDFMKQYSTSSGTTWFKFSNNDSSFAGGLTINGDMLRDGDIDPRSILPRAVDYAITQSYMPSTNVMQCTMQNMFPSAACALTLTDVLLKSYFDMSDVSQLIIVELDSRSPDLFSCDNENYYEFFASTFSYPVSNRYFVVKVQNLDNNNPFFKSFEEIIHTDSSGKASLHTDFHNQMCFVRDKVPESATLKIYSGDFENFHTTLKHAWIELTVPGAGDKDIYMMANVDDDNNDGIPDYMNQTTIENENDLMRININVHPQNNKFIQWARISRSNGNINLWTSYNKSEFHPGHLNVFIYDPKLLIENNTKDIPFYLNDAIQLKTYTFDNIINNGLFVEALTADGTSEPGTLITLELLNRDMTGSMQILTIISKYINIITTELTGIEYTNDQENADGSDVMLLSPDKQHPYDLHPIGKDNTYLQTPEPEWSYRDRFSADYPGKLDHDRYPIAVVRNGLNQFKTLMIRPYLTTSDTRRQFSLIIHAPSTDEIAFSLYWPNDFEGQSVNEYISKYSINTQYSIPDVVTNDDITFSVLIKYNNQSSSNDHEFIFSNLSWKIKQTHYISYDNYKDVPNDYSEPGLEETFKNTDNWALSVNRMAKSTKITSGYNDIETIRQKIHDYILSNTHQPGQILCRVPSTSYGWSTFDQMEKDKIAGFIDRCFDCISLSSAAVAVLRQLGINAILSKAQLDLDFLRYQLGLGTFRKDSSVYPHSNEGDIIFDCNGIPTPLHNEINYTFQSAFETFYHIKDFDENGVISKAWSIYPNRSYSIEKPFKNIFADVVWRNYSKWDDYYQKTCLLLNYTHRNCDGSNSVEKICIDLVFGGGLQ